MAISLVNSVSAGGGASSITTSGIDTTGANLLVIVLSESVFGLEGSAAPTDNKSNSWVQLTSKKTGAGNPDVYQSIYYSVDPTVGTGHTFTHAATNTFSGIAVLAFSGADTATPFDQENGNNGGDGLTSIQPGSVTPTEDNEVLVAGIGLGDAVSSQSVGSSFTLQEFDNYATSTHMGVGAAYKIQTTAGAENPQFSWTTAGRACSVIATFKSAGGSSVLPIMMQLHG